MRNENQLLTHFLCLTVNAAAFNKRDISPAAQVCINSITSVGDKLAETSPSVRHLKTLVYFVTNISNQD